MVSTILFLAVALVFLIIVCGPKAAVDATKAGITCRVYRNTGTYGSPTWAAVNCIRDATPNFPWLMADSSDRQSRAALEDKTQMKISVQVVAKATNADAGYQSLWDASQSAGTNGKLDLLILDDPLTVEGAMGVRAHFNVIFDSQTQGAGDNVYTTFTLTPGFSPDGVPSKIEVGASSTLTATAF